MNTELELQTEYKETFAEIHASEILFQKVKNISKETRETIGKKNTTAKRYATLKKIGMAVAALVVLIVGSNGMAYAATGSTWLKSMVVCLNGTEYSAEMKGEVESDNFVTTGWLMGENGPTAITIINDKDDAEAVNDVVLYMIMSSPEIVEQNGKIYFKDGDVQIDITEDAADGKASGTYQIGDVINQYEAEYVDGGWNLNISKY